MNDEQFDEFAAILAEYLKMEKVFIQNPQRMAEVNAATEIACQLFPEATITIDDDPLQMGALILTIEDFDLTVRETYKFSQLISKANNFEIYHTKDDLVKIAILFAGALQRI